jgi:hypothetical protein
MSIFSSLFKATVSSASQEAIQLAESKVKQAGEWTVDQLDCQERNSDEARLESARREMENSSLADQAKAKGLNYVVQKASPKFDEAVMKKADDVIMKTGIGKNALEKMGAKGVKEATEIAGKKAAGKIAKHGAKVVGEKVAKEAAEKGAKFIAKKLARCIPGVGLLTGGAIEAYEYAMDRAEIKEQYGPAAAEWLKENKGLDVAPEDIEWKHIKQYAESNPIVRKEMNAIAADAVARTAAGGFGIFGMVAELGYDVVDTCVGSKSAHEIMDDMAAKQAAGEPITAQEVKDMVNDAFSGEKGKTYDEMNPEQQAAFDVVAERYAEQLNSGEIQAHQMVAEVGERRFHKYVETELEMSGLTQGMSSRMDDMISGIDGVQLVSEDVQLAADRRQSANIVSNSQELDAIVASIKGMDIGEVEAVRHTTHSPDAAIAANIPQESRQASIAG